MKSNKIGFFSLLIILLLVFIIIFTYECLMNKEISNSSAIIANNENNKENINISIAEETEKITIENSENSDSHSTSSDSWGQETLPDETKTDENIITFNGNKVNENTATMILKVNIKTGEVSGVLQMGFKGFDMDINSTKICDYVLTGSITGNLDFKTFKIEGVLKGKAVTDKVSEDCKDYDVNYEMFANTTDDYSKIRGYFNTNTMDKYEFFLKQVNE